MNVPKLRFKEFTDEWKTHKLKDFFSKITKKNKSNSIHNVISNSAKFGLVKQIDYFSKDIANANNTESYFIIEKNDFVYNPRKSLEAPFGPICKYNYNETGIVSPLYLCFRYSQPINYDFFEYLFKSPVWYKYVYQNGDSGARHDRVNIKDSTFFLMPIFTPQSKEQNKIADFLSTVDKKISNLENIITNLENQKKGLLQQIFSQKLRFKDENGNNYPDWEKEKIGLICSISTGKSNTQDKTDDGKYPFYVRSATIERSSKYLYDEEAILTVGDGVGTGKVFHYVNGKYDLHQRCYRMFNFQNTNAKYFYYFFSSHFYNRVRRMSAKNSVDSVRMNMISDMIIDLPCLEEQTKIADFLSAFDRKIDNQKAQLEHWKQIKKGLLQQMFV